MNFKQAIRDQDYKPNATAEICRNCANLEQRTVEGFHEDGKARHSDICGIGRFYVKSYGFCRMYEKKE